MAKKRKLNPTPGQVFLGIGAVVLGLLAAGAAFAAEPTGKKKGRGTTPPPPPPPGEDVIAEELLTFLITPGEDPQPEALYQIQQGDIFGGGANVKGSIVRRVFEAAGIPDALQSNKARTAYMQCVSRSEFNRAFYGKKDDFTDGPGGLKKGDPGYPGNFPKYTSPDNISIRSAFLNKSANYVGDLANKRLPQRRSGGRLGLLWLPGIDVNKWHQLGEIVCVTMEPPPLVGLG